MMIIRTETYGTIQFSLNLKTVDIDGAIITLEEGNVFHYDGRKFKILTINDKETGLIVIGLYKLDWVKVQ